MGIHQDQLKIAEEELSEAMLNFCDAEAALGMAMGLYFEAKEMLDQKQTAVEQARPAADLEAVAMNNDCHVHKRRL